MTTAREREKDASAALAAVWVVMFAANVYVLVESARQGESILLPVIGTAISAGFFALNIVRYRRK